MSRVRAGRPKQLAGKLKKLRVDLGLTQEAMFEALERVSSPDAVLHVGYIARYEAGMRVPSLLVLLSYSRLTKVPLEILIDDDLQLPHSK